MDELVKQAQTYTQALLGNRKGLKDIQIKQNAENKQKSAKKNKNKMIDENFEKTENLNEKNKAKRNRQKLQADSESDQEETELNIQEMADKDLNKNKNLLEDEEYNQESSDDYVDYLTVQPSILQTKTLFDHQLIGLNWMISLQKNKINGILADDMGLGKTLQTVSIIAYMRQFQNINGPHLIISPLSVLQNWQMEFKQCLPQAKVVLLLARKEEREISLQQIQENEVDVIITSYEGVQLCNKQLRKMKFQYCVVDEAHKIKDNESLLAQALQQINCKFKLLLTGTPLQNNLRELWGLLNFIMPEVFDDPQIFEDFNRLVYNSGLNQEEQEKINTEFVNSLHQVLQPFMLRRTKSDALTLPPKTQIHIFCGLTGLQINLYKKLQAKDLSQFNMILMQLRKTCIHPYLIPEIEDPSLPVYGEHLVTSSGKMIVLDKLLKKLKNDKEKSHQVLIFSQFKIMLDILEDYCDYRGYKFCRIDGDVNLEERNEQMRAFTAEGSDKFIFLLSTRAGGLGINLYTADTVVLYDSDWNPQQDLQAIDRAHRIGQKNEVMVYRLITEDTVEEKMIERQQIKLKWDQHVIQKGRLVQQKHAGGNNPDSKELKAMVAYGAEKIFKNEGGTVTDETIDELLKRGKERTIQDQEELDKKFAEQMEQIGDLNVESTTINVFGHFNKIKEEDLSALDQAQKLALQKINSIVQRKQINGFGQNNQASIYDKLCSKLLHEVPRTVMLEEGQLYLQLEKLEKLLQKQKDFYYYNNIIQQFKDNNYELPFMPEHLEKKINQEFNEEEEKQINDLLSTGFEDWKNKDMKLLVTQICKYGKDDINKFEIKNKTIQDIEKYMNVFFERLNDNYFSDNQKLLKQIQDAEDKRKELRQHEYLIIETCQNEIDPLNCLNLKIPSKYKSQIFDITHDRWLIWANYKFGFKNWNKIMRDCRQRFILEPNIWTQTQRNFSFRLQTLLKILEQDYEKKNNVNKQSNAKKKQQATKMIQEDNDQSGDNENIGNINNVQLNNKSMVGQPKKRQVKDTNDENINTSQIDENIKKGQKFSVGQNKSKKKSKSKSKTSILNVNNQNSTVKQKQSTLDKFLQ